VGVDVKSELTLGLDDMPTGGRLLFFGGAGGGATRLVMDTLGVDSTLTTSSAAISGSETRANSSSSSTGMSRLSLSPPEFSASWITAGAADTGVPVKRRGTAGGVGMGGKSPRPPLGGGGGVGAVEPASSS